MNGKEVRVLRDTGCTSVVVRRDLVSDEQMLGKELDVTLINESKQNTQWGVLAWNVHF